MLKVVPTEWPKGERWYTSQKKTLPPLIHTDGVRRDVTSAWCSATNFQGECMDLKQQQKQQTETFPLFASCHGSHILCGWGVIWWFKKTWQSQSHHCDYALGVGHMDIPWNFIFLSNWLESHNVTHAKSLTCCFFPEEPGVLFSHRQTKSSHDAAQRRRPVFLISSGLLTFSHQQNGHCNKAEIWKNAHHFCFGSKHLLCRRGNFLSTQKRKLWY